MRKGGHNVLLVCQDLSSSISKVWFIASWKKCAATWNTNIALHHHFLKWKYSLKYVQILLEICTNIPWNITWRYVNSCNSNKWRHLFCDGNVWWYLCTFLAWNSWKLCFLDHQFKGKNARWMHDTSPYTGSAWSKRKIFSFFNFSFCSNFWLAWVIADH